MKIVIWMAFFLILLIINSFGADNLTDNWITVMGEIPPQKILKRYNELAVIEKRHGPLKTIDDHWFFIFEKDNPTTPFSEMLGDIVIFVNYDKENVGQILEIRWYDAKEKKRHRWINKKFSYYLPVRPYFSLRRRGEIINSLW